MICKLCNEEKTTSEMVKDKNKPNGVRTICKKCENLRRRKTPIKPIPKQGYKYCAKCNNELPIDEFNIRNINGVSKPFSYCKTCERNVNNNRYNHICQNCGKKHTSGAKETKYCKSCWNIKFSEIGTANLKEHNARQTGENNYFYGSCRKGVENPNYNPQKTDEEREKGRIIEGYKDWIKAVYERDKYTCQICGDNKGGNLNAHHLDGYNWCKEKRTDINNGVTLCGKCHTCFHDTYGYGKNTKEQFDRFKIDNMTIPR